jgi:phosphoribosylglycinamide formyltransferase-1
MEKREKLGIVVLISGNGSNLQAIIDAIANGLPININAVISNCDDAYGIERARLAGIKTHVIEHQNFSSRSAFDLELQKTINDYKPELIALAGFMRRLSSAFVSHFKNKIINIHPSLLPKFPGLHTHKKALEAKERTHGATIHFVTEELDAGPIVDQTQLAIAPNETVEQLEKRVRALEHQLYPKVLAWFAENRVSLDKDNQVVINPSLAPELGPNT